MRAALFSSRPDQSVECGLCNHHCLIYPEKKGLCGVRQNSGGELLTLVGDLVAAVNLDPVEKKPLYHFLPGSRTFSFGTVGCNFACPFCQNSDISRYPAECNDIRGIKTTPERLVNEAIMSGAASIAFTYNEPTVFFELLCATAQKAQNKGLPGIIVSNGFMSEEALKAMPSNIAAANIDLKAFSDDFYKKYCRARLAPVLDNLRLIVKMGKWLEVTTLLIPGVNDDEAELKDLASFIRQELGPEVPWHISRFHGAYKMSGHPPTPLDALKKAFQIGVEAGLKHVYLGNVSGESLTLCPACATPFASRRGYGVQLASPDGACASCGQKIAGVWTQEDLSKKSSSLAK